MVRAAKRRPVQRVSRDGSTTRTDVLAGEEPLEIQLHGAPYSVTMRTPGDDFDLVFGFLYSEQIIARPEDVVTLSYRGGVDPDGSRSYNVIDATLAPGVGIPERSRAVYTSSSCGVCGTASMEAIERLSAFDVAADPGRVGLDVLLGLPERLRAAQTLFGRTGGVHASGLFTPEGELVCAREDVGRHNALDKVVGWALREGRLPLAGHVLQVSGRLSFELVQKAHLAGLPVLTAVGAPSALAVEVAEQAGITAVGFMRSEGCNVYSHPERIG